MTKDKDNTVDDEQIARQLQEQFRREVEQYTSSSAWNDIHSVFTPDSTNNRRNATFDDIDSIPMVDAIPEESVTPPQNKKKFVHDLSFNTESTSPSTSLEGSPLERTLCGPVSIDEFIEVEIDIQEDSIEQKLRQHRKDEEFARRLEREMRDEALARELRASMEFVVPTTGADAELTRRMQREREVETSRGRWSELQSDSTTTQKIIFYGSRILSVVIVVSVTYLVYMMFWGPNASSGLDHGSWFPGWPEGDPSLGSVGESNVWDMNGKYKGLKLQVLNNLDEGSDWHQYFETAMTDWDGGTPDAVSLYLRSSTYDADCRAVRKAMKVCNGNYGPTDWRGVNQILLQDEYIITSLAKMNDYYLEGTNMAQKQYTMCHELGHGLGLGHTDENFYNRDLGNCMDYTERPENNMHPDETNFQKLEELYGNVDGTSVRPSNKTLRTRRTSVTVEEEQMIDGDFEYYSRFLSDPVQTSSASEKQLRSTDGRHENGYRLLRKTDKMEHYERNLGNGYTVKMSILLA